MELDAEKRHDYALLSDLRELRFLREEKIRVIRDERECLKRLNRDKIQENLQSIPGIGFRTAVVLQAELWDLLRFPNKDSLNLYVGLAPHTVGSGEHEKIKFGGNRKKKAVALSADRSLLASSEIQSGISSQIWSDACKRSLSAAGDFDHCEETFACCSCGMASKPAVEDCTLKSAAGIKDSANETL